MKYLNKKNQLFIIIGVILFLMVLFVVFDINNKKNYAEKGSLLKDTLNTNYYNNVVNQIGDSKIEVVDEDWENNQISLNETRKNNEKIDTIKPKINIKKNNKNTNTHKYKHKQQKQNIVIEKIIVYDTLKKPKRERNGFIDNLNVSNNKVKNNNTKKSYVLNIDAVVFETKIIRNGDILRIKILDNIKTKNFIVPKNSILPMSVHFGNSNNIDLIYNNNYIYNNNLLVLNEVNVYNTQGSLGILLEESLFNQMNKKSEQFGFKKVNDVLDGVLENNGLSGISGLNKGLTNIKKNDINSLKYKVFQGYELIIQIKN